MSDALTLNDINTFQKEIENDVSGTRQLPLLAAVVPAKCGTGTVWITKQGNRYFPMSMKKRNKKSDALRCVDWRAPTSCKCSKLIKKYMPIIGIV